MKPTCLSRQQLQEYSLGFLDDVQQSRTEQHLLECRVCDETLTALDDDEDSILRHLRSVPAAPEATPDPELEVAVQRVGKIDIAEQLGKEDTPSDRVTLTTEAETPLPDVRQLRDYQLSDVIGRGGMGTVYRGLHVRLQMPVAVKLLTERHDCNAANVARFEREMQAVGKLDHPAIVRATDAGEVDGMHFLAMELIDGVDLACLLRTAGPLNPADASEIIRQVSLGIQHAHDIGIVHRDLKPSNVMLAKHGQVKILDLGLAWWAGPSHLFDEQTTVGQLMGTLDYMAPEQTEVDGDITALADIYSLGATLYKLLCGHPPYDGEKYPTPLHKLKAIGHAPIEPLQDRGIDIPPGLAAVVHRALASAPQDRFSSAADFAAALAEFTAAHDLAALSATSRAACEANRKHELTGQPAKPRAEHSQSAVKTPPVRPRTPQPGGSWQWLLALAAATALAWAAMTIYLETGKGVLVIESAADEVAVTIQRAEKVHETLELKHGLNSIRLSAGSYEVVIDGESDSLVIDDGRFTLKRGGHWIARIRELPGLAVDQAVAKLASETNANPAARIDPAGDAGPAERWPLYEGRNIVEWLQAYDHSDEAGRFRALKAIKVLQVHPSSDKPILAELKVRFELARRELDVRTLQQVAMEIMEFAGARHRDAALQHLFNIAEFAPKFEIAETDPTNYHRYEMDSYFLASPTIRMVDDFDDALAEMVIAELKQNKSARRQFALCLIRPRSEADILFEEGMVEWNRRNENRIGQAVALAIKDPDLEVRRAATYALLCLNRNEPNFKERLEQMVREGHPYLDIAMVFLVESAIESRLVDEWATSQDNKKVFFILDRIYVTYKWKSKKSEAVEKLASLLSNADWGLDLRRPLDKPGWAYRSVETPELARTMAIKTLGRFGEASATTVPLLEAELKSTENEIAERAKRSIHSINFALSEIARKAKQKR